MNDTRHCPLPFPSLIHIYPTLHSPPPCPLTECTASRSCVAALLRPSHSWARAPASSFDCHPGSARQATMFPCTTHAPRVLFHSTALSGPEQPLLPLGSLLTVSPTKRIQTHALSACLRQPPPPKVFNATVPPLNLDHLPASAATSSSPVRHHPAPPPPHGPLLPSPLAPPRSTMSASSRSP